ncbi:MAG: bis-aminopropyl spermidine synthase family protein [Myxococcota bacterium]
MNEGVFRILRCLKSGDAKARSEVIRQSGEAHSVLAALELDKGRWFERRGETVQLTETGIKAHAWEARARTPALTSDELEARLREVAVARPTLKRELDQVFATLPTVVSRAQRLVQEGDAQRGVVFLGDDDLTSIALRMLLDAAESDRKVTAYEVDAELVEFLQRHGVEAHAHDLREPLPPRTNGRFGCVFTDPPYAPGGFTLFLNRAIPLLKNDGRIYVCFGQSRRASERGLQKQRILSELGLLIETVVPDFNHYDGAESIGARSNLWVTRRTPQSKALSLDPSAPLYTRDEP